MNALLALLLAATSIAGRYETPDATLELHIGHDRQFRGYLIDDAGVAALDPIRVDEPHLIAAARREDDSRTELRAEVRGDGSIRIGTKITGRARGLLTSIQPPIKTRNDILTLTVRGGESIATVRQHFSRRQPNPQGVLRRVDTSVTQRETWRRTPGSWKLVFVDEVRDDVRWAEHEH